MEEKTNGGLPDKGPGFAEIFSGIGIGLLVGTLVGLSVSPVVGTVLGALTAILAAILGLTDAQLPSKAEKLAGPSARQRRIRDVRIGSFGLACTAGILLGLFLRTHNLLGMTPAGQVDAWTEAGFDSTTALQLVAFQELGLKPEGWSVDVAAAEAAAARKGRVTELYSAHLNACKDLVPEQYANVDEALNAWDLQRGSWSAIALQIKQVIPPEHQTAFTELTWKLTCEPDE